MFNFLHSYAPKPVLLYIGHLTIYWYGLFIVLGILLAVLVVLKLAEKYHVSKETVIDSVFYMVIAGIIGARVYHVLLELPYYFKNPLSVFKIWEGGLAIHGAIVAGLITVWLFAKKRGMDPFLLLAIFAPGLALGQAIGRWGNYFNQELYGAPTALPWGIPIEPINRVLSHYSAKYFHPTFLYESLGCFAIFLLLLYLHSWMIKKGVQKFQLPLLAYLVSYSLLRFFLEFIRIDPTPEFLGLRFPQIISLVLIILAGAYLIKKRKALFARA